MNDTIEEEDYPHWNRIYIAVILFTIVVIAAIWGFSTIFTPPDA